MRVDTISSVQVARGAALRYFWVYLFTVAIFEFGDKIHGSSMSAFLLEGGLPYSRVGMVIGTLGLVNALTDLPTGIMADRYGRKLLTCCGLATYGVGLLCFLLAPLMIWAFAGAALMGLGTSFASGSFSAWFKGQTSSYPDLLERAATRGNIVRWSVSAGAGLVAYLLLSFSNEAVFLCGGIVLIASAFLLYALVPENYGSRQIAIGEMMRQSVAMLLSKGYLRAILIASLFADIGLYLFIVGWQPIWLQQGYSVRSLGLLFISFMLAAAVGGVLADLLVSRRKAWEWTVLGSGLQAVGLLLMVLPHSVWSVMGMILFELALGLRFSGMFALYLKLIPEELAASVLSGISTITSLLGFVTATAAGMLIEVSGLAVGLLFAAALSVVSCLMMTFTGSRYEPR